MQPGDSDNPDNRYNPTLQIDLCNREIEDDPGHIDKGGHKRAGGQRGVDPQFLKHHR